MFLNGPTCVYSSQQYVRLAVSVRHEQNKQKRFVPQHSTAIISGGGDTRHSSFPRQFVLYVVHMVYGLGLVWVVCGVQAASAQRPARRVLVVPRLVGLSVVYVNPFRNLRVVAVQKECPTMTNEEVLTRRARGSRHGWYVLSSRDSDGGNFGARSSASWCNTIACGDEITIASFYLSVQSFTLAVCCSCD